MIVRSRAFGGNFVLFELVRSHFSTLLLSLLTLWKVIRLSKCNPASDKQVWYINTSGEMEISHDAVDDFFRTGPFCVQARPHSDDNWWATEVPALSNCNGGYQQRWTVSKFDRCDGGLLLENSEDDVLIVPNDDKSLCIESLYGEEIVLGWYDENYSGLRLKPCEASNPSQIWPFQRGRWSPKGASGLCVELGDDMVSAD